MRKIILILSAQIIIVLSSCVKDADIELPNSDPMLVVSSFISPQDSLVQVAVSLSNPLYTNHQANSKYAPLLNASVIINNGISDYILDYNSKLERYVIDTMKLKIIAGNTYYLYVRSPDGKLVNAITTIPLQNTSFHFVVVKDQVDLNKYTLKGTWKDPINTTDYYVFDVRYTSFSLYSGYSSIFGSFTDTIKIWDGGTYYVKDSQSDGSTFDRNEIFIYNPAKNDTVFTSLTTISEEYFNYQDKFNLAYQSLSTPFSEPVQMYTNIKGGLGIFASFNTNRMRVFP
ncbi:MAG TPA: DUF4249 domain-containing protein [Bacteroidia bacterium]|nr:DUF4249 domain-containing protein [Bacteroidia bacterium]